MKILLILVLLSVATVPAFSVDLPDPTMSYVIWAYEGTEPVTLLNFPDGNGASFLELRDQTGTLHDGTITIVVLDSAGFPVVNYPKEDSWLQSSDGGMVPCIGYTGPDEDTDINGMSHWIQPMHEGGHSQAFCEVVLAGMVMNHSPLALFFNSPDMSGGGSVNLVDLGLFSTTYHEGYDFAADFHYDGVLNLADVALFAAGAGASCP